MAAWPSQPEGSASTAKWRSADLWTCSRFAFRPHSFCSILPQMPEPLHDGEYDRERYGKPPAP